VFIFGHLFGALAHILHIAITLFIWLVVARAVLSWVSPDPYNPIVRFINNATEPVMRPVRRRLPLYASGVDFTPLLVILALVFLDRFLVPVFSDLAFRLR